MMNSGISRRPGSLEAWTAVGNRRFQARGKYRDRDGPFITLRQNKHLGLVHCRGSKSFSSLRPLSPAVGAREVHHAAHCTGFLASTETPS